MNTKTKPQRVYYAKFYINDQEALASDSYIYLDGRLSLENKLNQARKKALYRNEFLNKGFTGIQIRFSNSGRIHSEYFPLTQIIPLTNQKLPL